MKLSVPFIPDPDYVSFLADHQTHLESVYFSLSSATPWDARITRTGSGISPLNVTALARSLAPLVGLKKYILLNTRFVPPALYTDTPKLMGLLDSLETLHRKSPVQGIVISDFYLANALDRTNHDMIPFLEAVPGINCMMDSMEKVLAYLETIEGTRFKMPGRLLLDRSLNRDLGRLGDLSRRVSTLFPDIKIELLANEGCIFHCPFKPAHDAQIALSNTGLVREATWKTNQVFGCHTYFFNHPHRFLKSPFIRPEDQIHYQGMAHTIKLCGRTLGPKFLTQCIQAYITQSHDGNLLDLMDASHFLAQTFHVDNKTLGPDFLNTLTSCTKECSSCRICQNLFLEIANKKSITLQSFKDVQ